MQEEVSPSFHAKVIPKSADSVNYALRLLLHILIMENVKSISMLLHGLLQSDDCEFKYYDPGHDFIYVGALDPHSLSKQLQQSWLWLGCCRCSCTVSRRDVPVPPLSLLTVQCLVVQHHHFSHQRWQNWCLYSSNPSRLFSAGWTSSCQPPTNPFATSSHVLQLGILSQQKLPKFV